MTWFWKEVSTEEYMHPGHLACQGCGATIAMRLVLKGLEGKGIVTLPACCWTIIDGPWPNHSLKVPLMHTAFETAAIAAAGIRAALDIRGVGEDVTVMAWAGDGGTFDIGIQALSGVCERNENILYVTYDNEAYMNTGIQRSGATPYLAWTNTTPEDNPKRERKKNILEIIAAHRIPYAATASIAYPDDLVRKVKKAKSIVGTKFIHILAPCPPGWKISSESTIKLARMAVESKVFPLVEVYDGIDWRLTYIPKENVSVKDYLKIQGRFNHLKEEELEEYQKTVDKEWERLLRRVSIT